MIAPGFDIRTLLDPAVYPWPVDAVRLIETHISWVLLAGDRVVKLKRPVDLGFVDFRDPARRKQACEDEVRLNRRLTTDVYLGVVPITANGVDAPGTPLEWATLMRRMPADRMLDVLLNDGTAPTNLADLLADRLIPFHLSSSQATPPSSRATLPSSRATTVIPSLSRDLPAASLLEKPAPGSRDAGRGNSLWLPLPPGRTSSLATSYHIDPDTHNDEIATGNMGAHGEAPLPSACPADPDTYLSVLTDNLDQVAEAAGDILDREQLDLVDRSMRAFMRAERPMLDERFQRWLVEGHGDLRCEHVCLEPDVMQIYDCVEFEIAIRCADVASDLAFLLMDLRRLGAQPAADELLARYRAAGFDLPQPVIDLYCAHRALVRAKVAALERSGVDPEHDLALAFEAASYLDLATAFATPIAPMLVLVSGLSGSGKSTVAAALDRATGGTVFASDRVRKELAGLETTESAVADWHQGIYSGDWTARTYDRLLELATAELAQGRAAIVDATFLDNEQRERFAGAAQAHGFPSAIVWTELDDAVARQRIERRAAQRNSPSDATVAIRERQQDQLRERPLRIPDGAIAVTIDTSRNGPASLEPFFTAMQERGLIGTLRSVLATSHA